MYQQTYTKYNNKRKIENKQIYNNKKHKIEETLPLESMKNNLIFDETKVYIFYFYVNLIFINIFIYKN